MRRGVAGLILGLSLVIASVSWAGFVMTRTVLDPNRSERLADQMLDNEVLRAALVARLSDGLGAALPPQVPVPRQQLEAASEAALEDPRVESLVRNGIVRVHQNALEGNDEPVTIDTAAAGSATRDQLVAIRPELDAVLPASPSVIVTLPTSGLSWLGTVRARVERFTIIGALVAAAGALLTLIVTDHRPSALRRVSFWAFGTAAFWLVVGVGIPLLSQALAPSSNAIIAAIVDIFFGAMIRPAIILAVVGVALLGLSFALAANNARRPAAILQPATGSPTPADRPGAGSVPTPARGGKTSNIRTNQTSPPTSAPRPDPTSVISQAEVATPQQRQPPPTPEPNKAPRWVEGEGYLDDGSPPQNPRSQGSQ